jgi:hypothetical protein
MYRYQWYLDSVALSGDTLNYIVPVLTGNYSVEISPLNVCYPPQHSTPYFFLNTGIIPTNVLDNVTVIPNPFTGNVRIQFQNKMLSSYEIKVADILGRNLYSYRSEVSESFVDRELDLSELLIGVYLLQISTASSQKTLKLVKE